MAPSITIDREIHANTRRTRVTYRGTVNGRIAAIKCYKKPAFGFVHWIGAQRRGNRIRATGAPLPPILYSGWFADERCFCFATEFLVGYQSLKRLLIDHQDRTELVRRLGKLLADLHVSGIEQPDGNLTNFMVSNSGIFAVVDEDDIRVHPSPLSGQAAIDNLANVGARLPNSEDLDIYWQAYLQAVEPNSEASLSRVAFEMRVAWWKSRLATKRLKKRRATTYKDAQPRRPREHE